MILSQIARRDVGQLSKSLALHASGRLSLTDWLTKAVGTTIVSCGTGRVLRVPITCQMQHTMYGTCTLVPIVRWVHAAAVCSLICNYRSARTQGGGAGREALVGPSSSVAQTRPLRCATTALTSFDWNAICKCGMRVIFHPRG